MSRTELPRRPAVEHPRRPAGRAWISLPLGREGRGEEGRGEEIVNEREEKE